MLLQHFLFSWEIVTTEECLDLYLTEEWFNLCLIFILEECFDLYLTEAWFNLYLTFILRCDLVE